MGDTPPCEPCQTASVLALVVEEAFHIWRVLRVLQEILVVLRDQLCQIFHVQEFSLLRNVAQRGCAQDILQLCEMLGVLHEACVLQSSGHSRDSQSATARGEIVDAFDIEKVQDSLPQLTCLALAPEQKDAAKILRGNVPTDGNGTFAKIGQ